MIMNDIAFEFNYLENKQKLFLKEIMVFQSIVK